MATICFSSTLHSWPDIPRVRSSGIRTGERRRSSFSELLLKWRLGLIQLIKTQLMFVLMAPQRQPERQASVIPASDEASAQSLYGLQMEENSPTVHHPTL